ncbi:MAG TPA: rhodanese-like domain-containing protein, partial [Candidatus Binatia bacterium]|nr:rhodanese-like domain-containing protein [Candidatus Binatia bacterium]
MTSTPTAVRLVGAADATKLADAGYRILDVREPVEWNAGHIPGATLLPLADVPDRIAEVVPQLDTPLLVLCAVGARSARAAAYLAGIGYTDIVNMHAS